MTIHCYSTKLNYLLVQLRESWRHRRKFVHPYLQRQDIPALLVDLTDRRRRFNSVVE